MKKFDTMTATHWNHLKILYEYKSVAPEERDHGENGDSIGIASTAGCMP
jgi:hypothetical protein